MTLEKQRDFLGKKWKKWRVFKSSSENKQWLYLYIFSPKICAWGTCSEKSDRLRRACLFDPQLTGKYDRRVDYLMLKIIYGMPEVWVFNCSGKATKLESKLKEQFGQNHCYLGFRGRCRMEISTEIVNRFTKTGHLKKLPQTTIKLFQKYLDDVYFRFRKHPKNHKRTFHFGDSLEPKFLRTYYGTKNLTTAKEMESAIEEVLQVKFYKDKSKKPS